MAAGNDNWWWSFDLSGGACNADNDGAESVESGGLGRGGSDGVRENKRLSG